MSALWMFVPENMRFVGPPLMLITICFKNTVGLNVVLFLS